MTSQTNASQSIKKNKKRTLQFKTEVSQLLDLMIHSLYSNRDVFLRELISNASDALDKLRFASLSNEALLEGDGSYEIKVELNKDANQLIVSDNGIGMNEQEVIENIGTIANSGTQKFLEQMGQDKTSDSNLIGQFGVGFYSSFMVASEVVLETRKAGDDAADGVRWSSKGDGKFSLQKVTKVDRGTRIVLNLRADAKEYLDDWKLKNIISQYSEHLPFPVCMLKPVDKDDDQSKKAKRDDQQPEFEAVNSAQALWLKSSKSIKEEEYKEFYKHISHDFDEPLCWMHNRVEGNLEYSSLIYIPKRAPFDLFDRDQRRGLKLYVKRVFIMDDAENFLPQWLRFVRGVIDCADLPLNVSREILQDNAMVRKIRSAIVKRVIDKIEDLASNDQESFSILWKEFGKVIKEGVIEDFESKQKIAKLLRFASTNNSNQELSLANYIKAMPKNQESIFYLCGESHSAIQSSPHLEIFKEKNIEVLLLSDRIDEWLVTHLTDFEGNKLQAVNRLDKSLKELDAITSDTKQDEQAEPVQVESEPLLERLKKVLGDQVEEVRQSQHLRSSPSCIVVDNQQMTHNMQKIMQAMGQEMQKIKPILEINIKHAITGHLAAISDEEEFADWANLLLDQALLAEGAQLENPSDFVSRLNRLLGARVA